MQDSANTVVYHFTQVNNDNNGNPQYKFNLYNTVDYSNRNMLRVRSPRIGARFSKRYDAYVIKYHGDEEQTAKIIEDIITRAGFNISTIKQ